MREGRADWTEIWTEATAQEASSKSRRKGEGAVNFQDGDGEVRRVGKNRAREIESGYSC